MNRVRPPFAPSLNRQLSTFLSAKALLVTREIKIFLSNSLRFDSKKLTVFSQLCMINTVDSR